MTEQHVMQLVILIAYAVLGAVVVWHDLQHEASILRLLYSGLK